MTVLALVAVPALLAGCGRDDLARLVPGDKVMTSSREAGRAAELISQYRRSRGLGPVVADGRLNAAAAHQARAVAEAGKLSHGDFKARMASYQVGGVAAENLSAGSQEVEGAIARWKRSSAHNENLLLKEASRIGLARADSPGYGYKHYWALVLAE